MSLARIASSTAALAMRAAPGACRTSALAGTAALLLTALAPSVAGAAGSPRVHAKIVGKSGTVFKTRTVSTPATTVAVGRKRCAVAAGTPLAALMALRRAGGPPVKLTDYGSCSRRAVDGGGLYVTKIGRDLRGGQSGWVYLINGRVGTAGAADPLGPYGNGLLRRGQRVTWFWCRVASKCEEEAR